MYAVIRAGGKQYRVAPGDVVNIEKASAEGNIDFEVLAVSGEEGKLGKVADATVTGEILGQGRGDKILVFKFKRKKQYKKMIGHRQAFTRVRISEISFDGQNFKAAALEPKAPKAKKAATADEPVKPVAKKKTAAKKTAAKKTTKK